MLTARMSINDTDSRGWVAASEDLLPRPSSDFKSKQREHLNRDLAAASPALENDDGEVYELPESIVEEGVVRLPSARQGRFLASQALF